jgi:DNA replication protein DnaC
MTPASVVKELNEVALRSVRAYFLANCGVPAMYREAAAWSPEQLASIQKLWNLLRTNPAAIVLLCGEPGTGKTHMACEIVMQWAAAGINARYATTDDMLSDIKDGFDAPGGRYASIRRFESPSLLVLDEFFRRKNDDWDRREVWRLLDRRYAEKRATVIISNGTGDGLKGEFDAPMWGRICQFGGAMEVGGQNWRMP